MYCRHEAMVVALLVLTSLTGAQTIWYVDGTNPNCPGTGSIQDPYCDIQTAIDLVLDGDLIEVAPGIYLESLTLQGRSLELYSSHGPEVTIIDGQAATGVIRCLDGDGSLLRGFTIRDGRAQNGGGANVRASSTRFENCHFLENFAEHNGGGIIIHDGSMVELHGCRFEENATGQPESSDGGGLVVAASTVVVNRCSFRANTNGDKGGGALVSQASSVEFTGCEFWSNESPTNHGGGMHVQLGSNVSINACAFRENAGGGLSVEDAIVDIGESFFCANEPYQIQGTWNDLGDNDFSDACTWHVDRANPNCPGSGSEQDPFCSIQYAIDVVPNGGRIEVAAGTYEENLVLDARWLDIYGADGPEGTIIDGGASAGVITCQNGDASILHGFTIRNGNNRNGGGANVNASHTQFKECWFLQNFASDNGGGALVFGGSPRFDGCYFEGNATGQPESSDGGGLVVADASVVVIRCSFVGNSNGDRGGGALVSQASAVLFESCEFRSNHSPTDRGGGVHVQLGSDVTFQNCTLTENTGGGVSIEDAVVTIGSSYLCSNLPYNIAGDWIDAGSNCVCDELIAVEPQELAAVFGWHQSGSVEDLFENDCNAVEIQQRPALSVLLPLIRVDIRGQATNIDPCFLGVLVDACATSLPTQPWQELALINYETSSWEMIDSRTACRCMACEDCLVEVTISENPGRFVDPNSLDMWMRLQWFDPGNVFSPNWGVKIDHAVWMVTE